MRGNLTKIVLDFGKIVKRAVEKQKMLGWQYNAVGVSDAITMGGEGWVVLPLFASTLSLNTI